MTKQVGAFVKGEQVRNKAYFAILHLKWDLFNGYLRDVGFVIVALRIELIVERILGNSFERRILLLLHGRKRNRVFENAYAYGR